VLALFAGALDEHVRHVVLRQTITDYRSLAVAERYSQPFGIYAYGLLKEFDVPQVASALAPRPVMLVNPVTPTGEPSGREAQTLYAAMPNVSIRTLDAKTDPVRLLIDWFASGS
jgi:hypothetical protein